MANVPSSVVLDAKRKAKELENFDCSKRRKCGIVLSPDDGSCNDNEDIASALKLLNKFRSLPFGTMTTEEKRNAMSTILA